MGKSIYPTAAKAILFLLTNQEGLLKKILPDFEALLGPVAIKSRWFDFPQGHYYEEEMGKNLRRSFISFKKIFEPYRLAEFKKFSVAIEQSLVQNNRRTINIDPGYVDLFKMVLASNKGGGQKVAVAQDIYAHTLLRYEKNEWRDFPWTFPDFKSKQYHEDLSKVRTELKNDI